MAAAAAIYHTFYAIGISYRKADAEIRGAFSLSADAIDNLLVQAKAEGIPSLAVISTCNRTELYGFAQHPFQLIKLLCEHSKGTVEEFEKVAYVHKNEKANDHLFNVGTGLDSQILGDFEIIGQLKLAFRKSKAQRLINPYMERLINAVIQASKRIKTETDLSSGATSVSFASVQYILENFERNSSQRITLFGTGKIGRNTCENLIKHTDNKEITLINRTKNKAELIAGKFDLVVKDYAQLEEQIAQSDILIVATGAQNPTVSKDLICTNNPLLILDLSIPKNVKEDVRELDNVTLVHLDELSKVTNRTLENRENFIPEAHAIISEIHAEFKLWQESRRFAPTMNALKTKLTTLKAAEIKSHRTKITDFNQEQADFIADRIIQKIAGHFANHLRDEEENTEEAIDLLNKIFKLEKVIS
ncbi:glutamyl-tRNA reductase [Nonlabens sp. MB-3u-79]|jgi:glutamyl-tRNA reductase|uniref:glutamyl-tRNA reductase n=1 Tax=Nonlabens sp. MB-3u-79 TaxID=2058134 RepID=UPI000C31B0CB|nr:glutamyl-tRNA reductase [Nonlabens sp. MB-3u-79]AUC78490.1 glutamyl-tRNA reductase [Nonlabens sp. MB-3u-79]